MSHRLEKELYELVQNDPQIFNFIEQSSLDGLWYWDLDSPEHEWMSPRFWLTLGYEPENKKHLASEWQDIINQDDLQLAYDNFTKHCEDPSHPYDQIVRYTHVKGHTVWIRCRGLAIRDDSGKPIRMLGAHTDLTEQKEAEAKLIDTIKSREQFFARMSHEIRTPLHGIIGLTDILREKNTDCGLARGLNTIADCGEQLLTLLNDLLTVSKLNDDKLTVSIEPVPVDSIVDYVSNLYTPRARAKLLEFRIDVPSRAKQLAVKTDKIRMTQIISNLVNNAIKFTSSGEVCLSVKVKGNKLQISVTDTGRGIEDIDSVFKPYQQENTRKGDDEGTGLGLEIVQRLCAELKHEIAVESEPVQGTSVSIICPFELRHTPTVETSARSNDSDHSLNFQFGNVLVVDDNEINREIAKIMLESNCNRVDCAADGEEALSMVIRHSDYDIILMDLNMPIKDGYRASTDILNLTSLSKQPRIIAVSADAFDETIEACKQVGMDFHLKKPFTKKYLMRTMFDALG